ncbi:hypothetical protein F5884DRAFT_748246 [Xylogone sp. PMI_703]|nr:hypothetical protein F5884DRAFT_748246 [Xylogone sp. PMI_703]
MAFGGKRRRRPLLLSYSISAEMSRGVSSSTLVPDPRSQVQASSSIDQLSTASAGSQPGPSLPYQQPWIKLIEKGTLRAYLQAWRRWATQCIDQGASFVLPAV